MKKLMLVLFFALFFGGFGLIVITFDEYQEPILAKGIVKDVEYIVQYAGFRSGDGTIQKTIIIFEDGSRCIIDGTYSIPSGEIEIYSKVFGYGYEIKKIK